MSPTGDQSSPRGAADDSSAGRSPDAPASPSEPEKPTEPWRAHPPPQAPKEEFPAWAMRPPMRSPRHVAGADAKYVLKPTSEAFQRVTHTKGRAQGGPARQIAEEQPRPRHGHRAAAHHRPRRGAGRPARPTTCSVAEGHPPTAATRALPSWIVTVCAPVCIVLEDPLIPLTRPTLCAVATMLCVCVCAV